MEYLSDRGLPEPARESFFTFSYLAEIKDKLTYVRGAELMVMSFHRARL